MEILHHVTASIQGSGSAGFLSVPRAPSGGVRAESCSEFALTPRVGMLYVPLW
jgi:hypothetical protein